MAAAVPFVVELVRQCSVPVPAAELRALVVVEVVEQLVLLELAPAAEAIAHWAIGDRSPPEMVVAG